jgi:hypothetical protein
VVLRQTVGHGMNHCVAMISSASVTRTGQYAVIYGHDRFLPARPLLWLLQDHSDC